MIWPQLELPFPPPHPVPHPLRGVWRASSRLASSSGSGCPGRRCLHAKHAVGCWAAMRDVPCACSRLGGSSMPPCQLQPEGLQAWGGGGRRRDDWSGTASDKLRQGCQGTPSTSTRKNQAVSLSSLRVATAPRHAVMKPPSPTYCTLRPADAAPPPRPLSYCPHNPTNGAAAALPPASSPSAHAVRPNPHSPCVLPLTFPPPPPPVQAPPGLPPARVPAPPPPSAAAAAASRPAVATPLLRRVRRPAAPAFLLAQQPGCPPPPPQSAGRGRVKRDGRCGGTTACTSRADCTSLGQRPAEVAMLRKTFIDHTASQRIVMAGRRQALSAVRPHRCMLEAY